jgi:hypothetical protein
MKKIAIAMILGLAVILAALPSAEADCRRVNVVQPAVVHQQAYVTPTVVQHQLVTSFLAVPVPVYPVFGVGYGGNAATADDVKALKDEIAGLRRMLNQPMPPAVPPAPADKPAGPLSPRSKAALDAKVSAAVVSNCAACHNPTKKSGDVQLVDDDGKLLEVPEGLRWKCYGLASSGAMPPKGKPPVSDADLQLIYQFAAQK